MQDEIGRGEHGLDLAAHAQIVDAVTETLRSRGCPDLCFHGADAAQEENGVRRPRFYFGGGLYPQQRALFGREAKGANQTRLPAAISSSRRVASRLRSSTTGNSSAASPLPGS